MKQDKTTIHNFFSILLIALLCSAILENIHAGKRLFLTMASTTPHFTYNDTAFNTGSRKIVHLDFKYHKYNLLLPGNEAYPYNLKVLDSVILFMKCNPEIRLDISSHTSTKGREKTNRELSEKRVKIAYDYLISNGISPAKLTYTGAGETQPLFSDTRISCEKNKILREQLHLRNNRMELTLIQTNFKTDSTDKPLPLPEQWITDDSALVQLLTGQHSTPKKIPLFHALCIHRQLSLLLAKEKEYYREEYRMYFPYTTGECALNVLVIVSFNKEKQPVLISDENEYRVYRYNDCLKSWTEIIR